MTLLQRRPSSDIRQELNRLFNDYDDFGFPTLLESFSKMPNLTATGTWVPAIELKETPQDYILTAEVPGIEKSDLDIDVTEQSVTIRGESRQKSEQTKDNVYRSELRYGRFYRQVSTPGAIMPQKATANFQNGMLTITLPKCDSTKEKSVKLAIK